MNRFWQIAAVVLWSVGVANGQERKARVVRVDSTEAAQTKNYWTATRMQQADVFPLREISDKELSRLLQRGTLKQLPSELGASNERPSVNEPVPVNVAEFPFSAAGRLFFRADATDNSCSASVIRPGNIVLTAAHCVVDDQGRLWPGLLFKRAYNAGAGIDMTVQCVGIWPDFPSPGGGDLTLDYAFIRTNEVSADAFLGLVPDLPSSKWIAVGYPGAGEAQLSVSGGLGAAGGGVVEMTNNPMGDRASGGPWIAGPGSAGDNLAIGVNALKVVGVDNSVWGPFFDSYMIDLYWSVARGCSE